MRYLFGDYVLDTQRAELHGAGAPIKLRRQAFQLLAYLLAHRDRVVPKHELLEHLWPDRFVGDAVLKACITALRKALGDRGRAPRFVRTLHGQGYRFVAAVEAREHLPVDTVPSALAQGSSPLPEAGEGQGEGEHGPGRQLLPSVGRESQDGEHKQVTVLCGALAEATTLATRLGPEAMYHLMRVVMALAQDTVQRYGGTLFQVSGEGFLALFGAPVAQEDHARRAVLAAFELHQRLHAPDALREQPHSVALCLGLHTGPVVVGPLVHDPRLPYTAVGDTLHVATRLQQQAAPDTILVSATTYRLVQDEVQGEAWESLTPAIFSTPMDVYAIRDLRRRRAGVPRRDARPLSRFVGRTQELALLHVRLAQALGGQGQVLGIAGEPGMGKSRLLAEFAHGLDGRPVTYCEGHCLAYGSATPYQPVRDLLRQLWTLPDTALAPAVMATVHQRLREAGIASEAEALLLLHLLDMPMDLAPLAALSPEQRKARTFALLRHLLRYTSQQQPLVLAVENLHWSDPTSEEWLTSLAEQLGDMPVLLLTTYRPGYQLPWLRHSAATQMALSRLSPRDSLLMLQSIPQAAQLPAPLHQAIVAKAAGNPFFVEELTWAAVAHGNHAGPLPLPDTIEAVLAARLDRLPPEAKRLVRIAAVIGPEVPVLLLQTIAELSEEALQRGLAHLQATEFLYETRLFPGPVYTFKHALTHEVAYGSLLQERRRVLHACIVETLEALSRDQVAEQVERLAHHALRGEVWDKALTYCKQAGEKAMAYSAYREAVGYLEQARVAAQRLPAQPDLLAQGIELRITLDSAFLTLGDPRRGFDYLCEAAVLAEALGDQRQLGRAANGMTHYFLRTGDFDAAIESGQRALVHATASGALVEQAIAHCVLGTAYFSLGDYRSATDVLRRSVAALEGDLGQARFGIIMNSVRSRGWLVNALAELGDFAEGIACGEEAVQIAEAAGHLYSAIPAQQNLGILVLRRGDLPQAMVILERALAHCRATDMALFLHTIALHLGLAYALSGRVAEALLLFEQVVEQAMGTQQWTAPIRKGEGYLLAGNLEEASTLAERALALSRTHKARGNEAWSLRLLGEIARHGQPPDIAQAEIYYKQALALAKELGMRPLQAHCHRGLGTLYATTGRREQARVALAAAINLYRSMEMTFWLPQAEAALAQVT
jgi:class 3 adenylate cyclase/DNA-binding winged helix-turn-helix (wHTH) protein/tetratricopeptide (TPR) repeat protein